MPSSSRSKKTDTYAGNGAGRDPNRRAARQERDAVHQLRPRQAAAIVQLRADFRYVVDHRLLQLAEPQVGATGDSNSRAATRSVSIRSSRSINRAMSTSDSRCPSQGSA